MRIAWPVRIAAGELTSEAVTVLSDQQVEQRLAEAAQWRRGDGSCIVRDLELADFAAAIAFVDRVAAVAEEVNHHPDILLHGWNKVRLTLSTHSQGGLTDADFELARRIERLL
jgi:4a-hydroxytetrahydrobiopterin dehydratase